ncbi:hypothetical protein TNCV_5009301 [Trichonephila clavipes]|nr:hypothetical protein TNCV_5009301 [Trichonephila clavipes]
MAAIGALSLSKLLHQRQGIISLMRLTDHRLPLHLGIRTHYTPALSAIEVEETVDMSKSMNSGSDAEILNGILTKNVTISNALHQCFSKWKACPPRGRNEPERGREHIEKPKIKDYLKE